MYPKAEILFPAKLIPVLKDLRGPDWANLVKDVSRLPETHPDVLAFCLMMIQLDGCLNCYAGSYKFMRGCAACAKQTIAQFKGNDAELLRLFNQARQDILDYQSGKARPVLVVEEEEPEIKRVVEEEIIEDEEEEEEYDDEEEDE